MTSIFVYIYNKWSSPVNFPVLSFTASTYIEGWRVPDPSELLCSSQVFPLGLPEEFTLIFTLALKKSALRDTIYLFQISDQQGYPQVFLTLCFIIPPINIPFLPHSLLSFTLSSSISYLWFITPFVFSLSPSLISLLHSHPLPPLRFIFSRGTFSIPPPPPLSFHASFVFSYSSSDPPLSRTLSPRRSSLGHLLLSSFIHLHCYSCVFHDEELEFLRVPIITESPRPDLNTQCVWWMEAKSPH